MGKKSEKFSFLIKISPGNFPTQGSFPEKYNKTPIKVVNNPKQISIFEKC